MSAQKGEIESPAPLRISFDKPFEACQACHSTCCAGKVTVQGKVLLTDLFQSLSSRPAPTNLLWNQRK